jgi:uncharacterized ParB-like nuclease family protein
LVDRVDTLMNLLSGRAGVASCVVHSANLQTGQVR